MPDGRVRRSYRHKNKWRTTQRAQAIARDGGCVVCGDQGTDGRGKGLIQSHVIAERMGGGNGLENVVMLCPRHSGEIDGGRRYQ